MNITISTKNALGGVAGIKVEGHPVIHYLRISVDNGVAEPNWVALQGVPEISFSINNRIGDSTDTSRSLMSIADPGMKKRREQVAAPLQEAGLLLKPTNAGFVTLEKPDDLPKALEILGFDPQSIARIAAWSDDAQALHVRHQQRVAAATPAERRLIGEEVSSHWGSGFRAP